MVLMAEGWAYISEYRSNLMRSKSRPMYVPRHFEERDPAVMRALMASHPLGTWVVHADGELVVNHIPFMLDPARGEFGTLVAHVARANPVWQMLAACDRSVVIFQGPESYITPSWYPAKHEHGKVVPTWNYAVVHAHGIPTAIDDAQWLRQHVTTLTDVHEQHRADPWQVSDAPADYIDALLKAIVGIEIPVTSVVGKWKTTQNRAMHDRVGTVTGLQQQGDARAPDMAALVQRFV